MSEQIDKWLTRIIRAHDEVVVLATGRFDQAHFPETQAKADHIMDWLRSAYAHSAPFLNDLDENGLPKKLRHLNLDAACNAADKWFTRLNQKHRQATDEEGDTETAMQFDDGYRIVRLLSVNALRTEGAQMGHCIGGGGYDERVTGRGVCLLLVEG